jgi:hypothetical protein
MMPVLPALRRRSRNRIIDYKTLWLLINILRQAELDFLRPKMRRKLRASAYAILFGAMQSPLPEICSEFGMDPIAARLLLLRWKTQGRIGDPIFGFLDDPETIWKVKYGLPLDLPSLNSIGESDNAGSYKC